MTRKPETDIMHRVMLAASRLSARVFRNNVGMAYFRDGTPVVYGLCPGSSDLVGWLPVMISPDMVGQTVAIFLAIETKGSPHSRTQKNQRNFLQQVANAGGLAVVGRDVNGVTGILEQAQRGQVQWGRIHCPLPGA